MSLPYDLVEIASILVIGGLIAVWWKAPGLSGWPMWGRGDLGRPRPSRRIRALVAVLLATVLVTAAALEVAGAPLGPGDQPVGAGHAWGGDDPRLLGTQLPSGGMAPGSAPPQGAFLYAYAPGAEIRTGITLANAGNAPLTVTGLEPSTSPYVHSIEFRLPPGPLTPDLVPVYPAGGPARWTSQAFRPFEIPAHGEVALGLSVVLGDCPGMAPVPTLVPGSSLPTAPDPAFTSGFTAVAVLRAGYTAFGIVRTATVTLHDALDVVTGEPGVSGCPSAS